jgi:hypothetical protein
MHNCDLRVRQAGARGRSTAVQGSRPYFCSRRGVGPGFIVSLAFASGPAPATGHLAGSAPMRTLRLGLAFTRFHLTGAGRAFLFLPPLHIVEPQHSM